MSTATGGGSESDGYEVSVEDIGGRTKVRAVNEKGVDFDQLVSWVSKLLFDRSVPKSRWRGKRHSDCRGRWGRNEMIRMRKLVRSGPVQAMITFKRQTRRTGRFVPAGSIHSREEGLETRDAGKHRSCNMRIDVFQP